jgi:hypothetical protein
MCYPTPSRVNGTYERCTGELYITVTYKLDGNDKQTTITVSQDKFINEENPDECQKTVIYDIGKEIMRLRDSPLLLQAVNSCSCPIKHHTSKASI